MNLLMSVGDRGAEKVSMGLLGFFLLAVLLALASLAHGQPGFISIDCGMGGGENSTYQDDQNQIFYYSDDEYIDTGINRRVESHFAYLRRSPRFHNVRSFPDGIRNCYTLQPVTIGKKYLIRAGFFYGNYDGLNSPPEFDLYVDTDLWKPLKSGDSNGTRIEIITMALMNFVSVCLLKTGDSTPFISVLELRPLDDDIYSPVNDFLSLALVARIDLGLPESIGFPPVIRYPDDIYDRIWTGGGLGDVCYYNPFFEMDNDNFSVPLIVMSSACMPNNDSLSFKLTDDNSSSEYHIFLHFAEVQMLTDNELRKFNISVNGKPFGHPVVLNYPQTVYNDKPLTGLQNYSFTMDKLESSTLPPILNALEIYHVIQFSKLTTYKLDVDAIMDIKAKYEVTRNWMGDPCLPVNYSWDGLECSYDDSNPPRIISLNLSSAGLTGEIAASISNLTSIKSLDLSNNNLSGRVPEFLAELPSLQFLNLSGNQVEGTVPKTLLERSKNGSLSLRYDRNPYLSLSESRQKKLKSALLAIIIPVVLAGVILLLIVVIIGWRRRRAAATHILMSYPSYGSSHQRLTKDNSSSYESWYFQYSDIVRMTNNFERVIGVGAFGKVCHGFMADGTPVAVKLLPKSSPQGSKKFTTEVQLLMGVRHRNLVSLIGFCDEGKEIALIYEYMAEGNLKQHLSGTASRAKSLDWGQRLRIAIDVAQGLEYLHDGCRPPIIHANVKSENILLNEKLEAKIAEYGLSKFFAQEEFSRIYITMNGTLAYLDPEFYVSQKLTQKSDVYSFGIVLLELITGQPAIIKSLNSEKISIVNWVKLIIDNGGNVKKLVDPKLEGDYNSASVWKATQTAMACTELSSIKRPTIRDVITELNECLSMGVAPDITLSINKY